MTPADAACGVPGAASQLQAAKRAQPSYTRGWPLRATPVPPRRSHPGAQRQEVQGEASQVPGEAEVRRARSPAPQASRTAPLGASMRPWAARTPPPRSISGAGPSPRPRARARGWRGGKRSQSLRSGHHWRSPLRPPPGLRRTSPAQPWPCPLWTPDSGFSPSFRKGRFFSVRP